MKKSEKNLLNAVYEKIEDNTSFERIINKSGVDLGANSSKQAFKISIWRKSLAYALTFIAIIALIIPLSLFFIKGDGVEKIVISNLNDLIVEYQLNGSFIASGISVQKQLKNGSLEACLQDEIEIDYSAFKEGVAGEYPIVVIPMCTAAQMLHTRNLFYTAVTRAQNMVILVGREDIIREMVENDRQSMRYTGLCRRLGGQ